MLRARSSSDSPWENFNVCLGEGYDTIYSLDARRYVRVEWNYPGTDCGMLRARATSVGEYEKFPILCYTLCG